MKLRNAALVILSLAFGIALISCSGAEQSQTETPAAQGETAKGAEAYPIDFCVVSGEKLGSMGEPVVYNYNGRTVKFCCGGCIEKFESAPAMYIAKLDSAAAGLNPSKEEGGMEGHEGHGHGG